MSAAGVFQQLVAGELGRRETQALLAPLGLNDWQTAWRNLQRMARSAEEQRALAQLMPDLLNVLQDAADPERALTNLERLAQHVPERVALWSYLADNPRAVQLLVTLFSSSQFLSEILLRNSDELGQLTDRRRLAQRKTVAQLCAEARQVVQEAPTARQQLDALRRFQRRELLRIGAGDLFALLDLPAVTAQLSRLADSMIQVCLDIVARHEHLLDNFVVIALGKLGGEELNYSSDIDLLFITSDASRCRRLGERLIEALSGITDEGFLYRVDMRLRPWGNDGPLVSSLDGYVAYMRRHAQLWEKQALLKARPVAGNLQLGREFMRQAECILFDRQGDAGQEWRQVRASIRAMKERTEAHLRQIGRDWGEVKLGVGSIRDVEFVTQYLQLLHGAQHPRLRSHNTLEALHRLRAGGWLTPDQYRTLSDGYVFLRTVEHHLQIMEYRQTARLPGHSQAILQLAHRLGFHGPQAGARFLARYQQHCSALRAVYQHFLVSDDMNDESPLEVPIQPSSEDVHQHMARMDASYGAVFDSEEIKRHAALAEQLDDDNLVEVDVSQLSTDRWRVTVVAYDYPGELSLICGLLSVYGFTILDGYAFTYEPLTGSTSEPRQASAQKIVDVFTVESVQGMLPPDVWARYRAELADLLRLMQAGQRSQARGLLAKRVAEALRQQASASRTLYPVEIEIDNSASERYTVLRIAAPDTVGFLYELTNALAINHVYIARVTVDSVGNWVRDTLYVTDNYGQKITAPEKQRALRATTVLTKHFTHLLPRSPNPETAILHFRELLGQLVDRPNWPDELASLERPEVLDALARLLGVSDFLWDDFLRMQYSNLFPVVRDVGELAAARSQAELRAALTSALQAAPDAATRREVLNAFKDREMFRIDMRNILGHITQFGQFSAELTDLAEVVVAAALELCLGELRARYGAPLLADGRPCPVCVCGLGKCGGRELGFASDIELMFIFAGNGHTTGVPAGGASDIVSEAEAQLPASSSGVISTAEFYEKLVQEFIATIRARREGIFEIDLQLRPYGSAGSMAVSLDAFRRYFAPGGAAWPYERQALVKLRPIAGDRQLGEHILALRDQYVYGGEPFDPTAMRAMRERQLRHLVTPGVFNAKFSPGGLVDLEYLVQGLQITHGATNPALRQTNTGQALTALAEAGILSTQHYQQLRQALIFLRRLINALRMVRGNARDLSVPAADSEEFAFLARRLGYENDTARLRQDLTHHTSQVQELSRQLLPSSI